LTIRPVTQTAEVDVNNASMKEHPFVFEIGSIRRNEPTRITERNPIARIRGGVSLVFIGNCMQNISFFTIFITIITLS